MSPILRYDEVQIVITPLNPIEDLLCWLAGLSSTGYVSDILRTVHGIASTVEIGDCAKLIALHATTSAGLVEQAYSGSAEVSFLPLYYAILNLSKIYIILAGKRLALETNRWHGATYNATRKSSRDLITEKITLKPAGVFPLFYEILTGEKLSSRGKNISLSEVYPYIYGVSYEYQHAYGEPSALQPIHLKIEGDPSVGYVLVAQLIENDHPNADNARYLQVLRGFRLDPKRTAQARVVMRGQTVPQTTVLVSKKHTAPNDLEAQGLLMRDVRRYLLYQPIRDIVGNVDCCWTPLSNRRLKLPEEIPIWIAFFHLSNLVRYNPEFLSKLKDSKAWPMLLTLRKHALLRFLLLFWSYLHQTVFELQAS